MNIIAKGSGCIGMGVCGWVLSSDDENSETFWQRLSTFSVSRCTKCNAESPHNSHQDI